MTKLTITVVDLPTSCGEHSGIRLLLQTKKNYLAGADGVFSVELGWAANRKGEEHWVGDAVHFHGDGRRFIYLAWVDDRGQMFRRIKLYLSQIPDLTPEAESASVTISGRGKDGSPACATAKII